MKRKHIWAIVLFVALIALAPANIIVAQTANQSYYDAANNSGHFIFDLNLLAASEPGDSLSSEPIGYDRPFFSGGRLKLIEVKHYKNGAACDAGFVRKFTTKKDGKVQWDFSKIKEVTFWGMIHCYGDDDDAPYAYAKTLGWRDGDKKAKDNAKHGYKATLIRPLVWEVVINYPPDVMSKLRSTEFNWEFNKNPKLWCFGPNNESILNKDTGNPELIMK